MGSEESTGEALAVVKARMLRLMSGVTMLERMRNEYLDEHGNG